MTRTENVRVRFAPSPTGNPHIGNVRTAIFAWLFARRHDGAFMIRVEDTDQDRREEGAVEAMLDSLSWIGLDWDEGPDIGGPVAPYVQSERLEVYHRVVEGLIECGQAYRCYCTPERLQKLRDEQAQGGADVIGYDRYCLKISEAELSRLASEGVSYVVRFKMPDEGISELDDIVFGHVEFDNRQYDDFVAIKSDGFPTYHLASVVDDHYMGISHVMRGKEWLPSVPRHVQLYAALGWDMPEFAHLPVILAPDKTKLSKRHGAASVMDYRDMGVLPEALMNYLTLLGWSLDDKSEFFTTDELISNFDPHRVSRSDAVFDFDKLLWLNGQHIRNSSEDKVAKALAHYWEATPPDFDIQPDVDSVSDIVPLVQERLKTLDDAAPLVKFVFSKEIQLDPDQVVQRGMDPEGTRRILEAAYKGLSDLESFETGPIESLLRPLATELGVKVGQLLGTLRVATTGQKVSPPIFESLEVLGKDRSLELIEKAAEQLQRTPVR